MTLNPVCNEETPPAPAPSPLQASRLKQFSALLAKYMLQDGIESDDDCFAGKKGDESNASGNGSTSGDSDDEVYT